MGTCSHAAAVCTNFTMEHALICSHGGLASFRHNEIRSLTANLLAEVCRDVVLEPDLQPLIEESLWYHSTVTTDETRLGVCSLNFWGIQRERAYFDVKVLHPLQSLIGNALCLHYTCTPVWNG